MQLAGAFDRDRPRSAVLQLLAFGIDDLAIGVIVDREGLQPGDVVRHRVKDLVGFRLDLLGRGRMGSQPNPNRKCSGDHAEACEAADFLIMSVSSLVCIKNETPRPGSGRAGPVVDKAVILVVDARSAVAEERENDSVNW